MFVALAGQQANPPFSIRLIPFIFSVWQAYVLELGPGYLRIFLNDSPLLSGGSPVQLNPPYQSPEIQSVHYSQSADTLFLACGRGAPAGTGYPLATLTRDGSVGTTWHYQTFAFRDGPYLSINPSPTTFLQPIAGLLQMGITGSANNGSGFVRLTVDTTATMPAGASPVRVDGAIYTGTGQSKASTDVNGEWIGTLVDGTHIDLLGVPYQGIALSAAGSLYAVPSGTLTLKASDTVGINNGLGFQLSDVGRHLRLQTNDGFDTAWIWGTIATVTNPTQVDLTMGGKSATADAVPRGKGSSAAFYMGAFGASPTLGYPYLVGFWGQRLVLFGTQGQPNAVWLSYVGAFDTFGRELADGTVTPACGLYWVIDTTSSNGQINAARWMHSAGSSEHLQLGLGTAGGEAVLTEATQGQPLSATNVQVYQETAYGAPLDVNVLRIGKAILFCDLSARKIREWSWYWQVAGYLGPDKTAESEHITRGPPGTPPLAQGIRVMAYQQSPYQVVWATRNDGGLFSVTYDHDQEIWAPAQHQLGGQYFGATPFVESVCTIPSPDGTYDELWLLVIRSVGGAQTRTIEVMTRYFDGTAQDLAWFSDCAMATTLIYPATTIDAIAGLTPVPTLTGTAVQTSVPMWTGTGTINTLDPVFAGDNSDLGKVIKVNGGRAVIVEPLSTQGAWIKVVQPLLGLAPAPPGQWTCTPQHTNLYGISWAPGEVFRVQGDGADFGPHTVHADGSIALKYRASFVVAGWPYSPVLVSEPFESQKAALAASRGKAKRLDHLYLRFHETIGCTYGRRQTDPKTAVITDLVETLDFRLPETAWLNQAPPLFSGIRRLAGRGGYDLEGQVIVAQDAPLPLTVLSINASVDVGDVPPNAQ
jgi:hypothetical protein